MTAISCWHWLNIKQLCVGDSENLGMMFFSFSNTEKFMLLRLLANTEQDAKKSARCFIYFFWMNQVVNSKRKMQGCLCVILAFLRYLNKGEWLPRCPPQSRSSDMGSKKFLCKLAQKLPHLGFQNIFKLVCGQKTKQLTCLFSHCISAETVTFACDNSPFFSTFQSFVKQTLNFWETGYKLHNTWKKINTIHEAFIFFYIKNSGIDF